jgi:hypothetical protein
MDIKLIVNNIDKMAVADGLAEAIDFAVLKMRTRTSTAIWMSERAGGEPGSLSQPPPNIGSKDYRYHVLNRTRQAGKIFTGFHPGRRIAPGP